MYAKKSAPLIATVALLFLAGSAFAGSIDFSYTGQDSASTWTWGGGTTTLSATANKPKPQDRTLSSGGPASPTADPRVAAAQAAEVPLTPPPPPRIKGWADRSCMVAGPKC